MKVYQEIILRPSSEISHYFLWEKLYQQVHIAFANIKNVDESVPIGVCFPEYDAEKNHLGSKLRLFAEDTTAFRSLNIDNYLSRLKDYIHISSIKEVPSNIESFALFKRQQVKSSITRLARRKAKRQGMEFEEALASINGFEEKQTKAPYIQMESLSSDKKGKNDQVSNNQRHKFRLFIVKQSFDQARAGTFNCYGLSLQATVPWF